MKTTRFLRAVAGVAASALTLSGLAAVAISPASAATKTTVIIVGSNALTSLNSGTPSTNLVSNSEVGYLTGSGFNYYNDKRNLVKNTTFGTYRVVKNTASDFRVQYTVKPGRVWSDGTPITGVDLLLSHVTSSSKYSIAAGLGDPDSEAGSAFYSGGYGGVYDSKVVGNPTLSADKMSVTVRYSSFQPDWEIMGPGPSAVHTLVLMAAGKKKLGTASENLAAKETFLKAYNSRNTNSLKAMGKIWSYDYNIKTIDSSTNPLLLVSNGGFMPKSAVADQSITLVANPRYNSGPKMSGMKTLVYRFMAEAAAAQALANGEINVYKGQPTADSVASLKAMSGVTVIGGTDACYEHVDLRHGAGVGEDTDYTGPFATSNNATKNAKARDLRTAFLLAYPREEIVEKLIKPINSRAVVVNTSFKMPGETGYNDIVKGSGVSKFTAGTQESRTAAALALVKKHFPDAAAGSKSVPVKMLWGALSNSRRAASFELAKAAVAKAGFELTNPSYTGGWSGHLDSNKYDAQFYAWCPSSVSQTGTNANFLSDGSNNSLGFANAQLDTILRSLEAKLTPAQITAKYTAADKIIVAEAVSLPIFQHPAATAFTTGLKGIKPAPLTPNIVWNYWEWKW
jgi:peptide/nickel transport system substrate-binding protein